MTGGSSPAGTGTIFLGRRDELTELRAGLDDVVSGRGRVFLLAGEAGIGKTRLLQALIHEVEPTEVRAVVGRCRRPRAAPPLRPWVEALGACIAELAHETLVHHLGPGASEVAAMVPELAQRLPGVVPAPPSTSSDARVRRFDAVSDFLRNVAADGGLVVGFDDLHAADEASLRLLRHVVERVGQSMVLLVGTYRDADVRSLPHLHRLIAAIARHGRRLVLGGLDEHDVTTLLKEVTAENVAFTAARELHRATDGNPLFVKEAARLLQTETGGPRTLVPDDVHDLIRHRLDSVPGHVRQVLDVAAVVGRPFDLAVLGAVSGVDPDALADVVREAAAQDLIVEVGPGRWWFTHELVHETLYDDIRVSRRVALHRQVGEVLVVQGSGEATHVGELAHHFFEAARGGNGDKARRYCTLVGDAAMTSLAFEDAATQYGRALEALAVTPPVDERERHDLLMRLARATLRLGDLAQAREFQSRALKSARAVGSGDLLAQAAVGLFGEPAWTVHKSQWSVLAEARAALPDSDSPLLARVLIALAAATNGESAVGPSDQALAMARRLGDPDTLQVVLGGWYDVNAEDRLDEGLVVADELLVQAREAEDAEALQRARQRRARQLLVAGDVAAATAELEVADQEAERLRLPSLVAGTTALRAGVAVLQGGLEEAERLVSRARAAAAHAGLSAVDHDVSLQLYALRREQGRPEEAVDIARQWAKRSPDRALARSRALLALALAELGKREEARREIGDVATDLLHDGAPGSTPGAVVVAAVSWIVGEAEWAEPAYQRLLRWPDRHVVMGAGCSLGASSRYLGQLAALLGRLDDADAHFEAAHRLHERLGAHGWLAHGWVDHARLLVARDRPGDVPRARELLLAAQQAYRALGMTPHQDRAAALFEGQSQNGGDARAETGVFALEGEYWAISYGGAEARLRDSKGLRYLARLLQTPGQELHALDLVVGDGGRAQAPSGAAQQSGLGAVVSGDAGAVLDAKAKTAYKRRLSDLEAELDEAAANNDLGRTERAQREMDFLMAELAAAVGLGGRDRKAVSDAERARQSVTRAIKGAVERIAAAHPDLGEHLRTTVRTGIYSAYVPDPRVPIRWKPR